MNFILLQNEVAIGAVIAAALGLVLLAVLPRERAVIRNVMVLLALFIALHAMGVGFAAIEKPRAESLLRGLAAVGIGAVIIRLGGIGLFRVLLPRLRFTPARIVEDLFTTGLFAAWCLFWLHGVGLDLASLLTTSAVITAVLAFAMQDTLGNVLGGLVLQLDDSLRVGDWVKFDDVSGQVVDVRWRHTAIETRNRETVVIPNGWLVKNRFTVIGSRKDPKLRWRRWVWFNIDVGAAPGEVCKVLENSVRYSEISNVVADPLPNAVLMDVGEGFARYALRYWLVDPRPDDPTDSAVRMHALAALARHRIRLAVTQQERLITKESEARQAALREEDLRQKRLALSKVDLFRTLSDGERNLLAESLVRAPFVAGDTMTRQGAVAHWLYLIIHGDADVWVDEQGVRTAIATLAAGSVFGEMGMMTGEPRQATVTARSDVDCFRLDKASFEAILRARPDIADEVSKEITARRGQLETVREAANAGAAATPMQDDIRARIRAFFGLDAE